MENTLQLCPAYQCAKDTLKCVCFSEPNGKVIMNGSKFLKSLQRVSSLKSFKKRGRSIVRAVYPKPSRLFFKAVKGNRADFLSQHKHKGEKDKD